VSALRRRVDELERRHRIGTGDPCPEHLPSLTPASGDVSDALRSALRAFSPDAKDRQAYQSEQDTLAARPPCRRCGWQPFAVFVTPAEIWGPPAGMADDEDVA
jgi:hypothetical protein